VRRRRELSKKDYHTAINGILIVDKPAGWTSHDVCHFVRKRFRIKKVGHAGILDKTATGVLIVLLGMYTKMSDRFLNQDKEYEGTMKLGSRTSTHDASGDVLEEKSWEHVTEEAILGMMKEFEGEIEQLPPMASAVKLGGVRLYKLALKGKEIERPTKTVIVHELKATEVELPLIQFKTRVSKGTYVRTLVNDIGLKLGTCAHLAKLCRTSSGMFPLEEAVSVELLKSLDSFEALRPYVKALPLHSPASILPQPSR